MDRILDFLGLLQSTLPSDLEQRTVGRMKPGERGFIEPNGMFANWIGFLWINKSLIVATRQDKRACVLIERLRKGVKVDRSTIPLDQKYARQERIRPDNCLRVILEDAFQPRLDASTTG